MSTKSNKYFKTHNTELEALCVARGLSTSGTKIERIARLVKQDHAEQAEDKAVANRVVAASSSKASYAIDDFDLGDGNTLGAEDVFTVSTSTAKAATHQDKDAKKKPRTPGAGGLRGVAVKRGKAGPTVGSTVEAKPVLKRKTTVEEHAAQKNYELEKVAKDINDDGSRGSHVDLPHKHDEAMGSGMLGAKREWKGVVKVAGVVGVGAAMAVTWVWWRGGGDLTGLGEEIVERRSAALDVAREKIGV
ncbi:hypothetical protein BDV95DRAFT_76992 [Massariosphaeria phaeospora]|uniref:SAP domain-containing protein n=1 Tax=Massariosphaeria phaeospora TaxID=100035 RepID=A0A7C8IBZ4_9PLEO|nr:hypothetical protein BDV95DRAFT_76992 [Massariosphaeria phaeospora]